MPPKKSKDKPRAELRIAIPLLLNLFKAIDDFTCYESIGTYAELYKGGLVLRTKDDKQVSILTIALSRSSFEYFKVKESFDFIIDDDLIYGLYHFIKDEKKIKEVELVFKDDKLKLRLGENLRKTLKFSDTDYSEIKNDIISVGKTVEKMISKLNYIVTLNAEELAFLVKTFALMHCEGVEGKFTFDGKDKELTLYRQLDHADDVFAALGKLEKGVKVRAHFEDNNLSKGIRAIAPLADELMIFAETDHPLLITAHNTSPEDITKFQEDLELWYVIAPRIHEDD